MDVQKFGKFIAKKRKEKKMTQMQMGEKLGVTGKTISRWENGNYMPDIALLLPIAELLEVSVQELLEGECAPNVIEETSKVEVSLVEDTVAYAKIRRILHAKKYASIMMLFTGCIIGLVVLIHIFFFAELPSKPGDTSKWDGLFASHSAYQLKFTEYDEPVFSNPKKAFEKAESDYSDALQFLKEQFRLLPFSIYTTVNYQKYCNQVLTETVAVEVDEIVEIQLMGLSQFLEIYRNSYGWKQVIFGSTDLSGEKGGLSMSEEVLQVIAIIITLFLLGIGCIAFSFWFAWENRKRNRFQGITEGKVIGMVKSGLFKNETFGEFPGGVLIGWGVARGEQYWGGTLKMDVPPWFPCVRFQVNEEEYHVITGCGTLKGKWEIGQNVNVLYDPNNPRKAYLEGDNSYTIRQKMYLTLGVILLLACGVAYGLLMI